MSPCLCINSSKSKNKSDFFQLKFGSPRLKKIVDKNIHATWKHFYLISGVTMILSVETKMAENVVELLPT